MSDAVGFNHAPSTLMHIDLNSCFASVEQQANPVLRGRPVVVAAYVTDGGCVLAASREAKVYGINTGMRVKEARSLYRDLVVLPSDPYKYRYINRKLVALMRCYTSDVEVKSIDEMVLAMSDSPALTGYLHTGYSAADGMKAIGLEIKKRIKKEIGDWLTVSVGISTNRYLAKVAAGLHKPDGLDEINRENVEKVLGDMALEDLTGIKSGYGAQLRRVGINDPVSFYRASSKFLQNAFHSIIGYHWWLRLHGWEADDRQFGRHSFGQSYALYKPYPPQDVRTRQILCQLTEKMSRRMRSHGYKAGGIHVACFFTDHSFWHKGRKLRQALFAGGDLYREALRVLAQAPDRPVRLFAVSCHYLNDLAVEQQLLFEDMARKKSLIHALDEISERWGEFTVKPARMLSMEHKILDRIAFGGIKDLEEFMFLERLRNEPE